MRKEIDFISGKRIAVVGVSRDKKKFGYIVFNELLSRGYNVIPINPQIDEVNGITAYKNLSDCPLKPDAVVIVVKPDETIKILKEGNQIGVKNFWFQPGSESKECIEFCYNNSFEYVKGKCLLMYLEPVKGIHKFHRFFAKIFGSY